MRGGGVALVRTRAPGRLADILAGAALPDDLVRIALTHASHLNETGAGAASNERLEFLGDAVLGLVVARDLYQRYPEAGEGELTRMRADLVRGRTLAAVAADLGLGEHLIMGKGEEAAGGRARERNLAGGLEALIGAVYVANGYRAAGSLIRRLLAPRFGHLHREGAQIDPKSGLQHRVQARWHQPPEYVTVEEGPAGASRRFTVEVRVAGATLGRGTGVRKSQAQQEAARQALTRLDEEAEAEV